MNDRNDPALIPGNRYAVAYELHYTARHLMAALHAYGDIIATNPGSAEAGYSRSQIRNIANQVVPEAEMLASETELALRHLQGQAAVAGSPSKR